MAGPLRLERPGALYHVIARGNERTSIYRDDGDRQRYLGRLAFYREKFSFQYQCLTTWGSRSDVPDRGGGTRRCRTMVAEQPRASVTVNVVVKSPVEPAVPNASNAALPAGNKGDTSKKVVLVS